MNKIVAEDLDFITNKLLFIKDRLDRKNIFITGGTGFIGKWLCFTLDALNKKHNLGLSVTILSRQPSLPKILLDLDLPITHLCGDICSFDFPEDPFDVILHAATDTNSKVQTSKDLFSQIVIGTQRCLEFAVNKQVSEVLLFSSGAVYGELPDDLIQVPETYHGGPILSDIKSLYGEGKRAAEMLATIYFHNHGIKTKIARCFAMLGPFMSLDGHYAIGNFINNCLNEENIVVKSDGSSVRSYIYMADLMVWIFSILFIGKPCYPYNVGSDKAISIKSLAETVHGLLNKSEKSEILFFPKGEQSRCQYVPNTARARTEMNLNTKFNLTEAIERTAQSNFSRNAPYQIHKNFYPVKNSNNTNI